ncbi:T9SS type B sorting domain-containing protein [Perlabentimonas gracilis]|uniref:T9SS type B sorting domain-containing protein n=1 Tax=Perlabentimonas gracilis TaxID=2715279 RepID=UPI00140C91C6|nr:gliding motility-associated C-terminal domain-containing protein [Perlabentimonas gracilis]NHB68996.1 T9SS type B sorting domain-containing protein [Perlabentimonas gracilis]
MKQLLRSSILLCAFFVASLGAVAQMTVDVTVNQHVSCPGGDDARLTIVVSNGPLEPMSVLVWNTTREKYEFIPIVGPSATIVLPDDGEDPVQSGSFIVFVSGPSGSATADPFEIFQPDDLIVNTINPTCGVPTGTIEFTSPTNDKGIYTFQYSIDDGTTYQSSPSFPGLTSGDYDLRVEISSHTSCELTAVESINPPPAPPDEPVLNPTQPDCDEPTGSIEVLSPIDPDFEYAINIMGPWQDATTFSGLAADNIYTIFVRRKSDNSCLNSKSVSINPAPSTPPAPTVTTADATCGVGGTIEVTAPLGAQYSYSINGVDYQANPLFSDVPAGTYNVTANEGGCISDPTTVTINPPAAAPEIDNVTHSDPTTVGGIEGSITVNLLGGTGTPDFTYYLTGSSSANSGEISASSYTFTGLGAGTYTVYVTDAASCTSASITDIILEDPIICTDAEIVLTSGNDNQTICEGEALENIVYSINGDFGDVSVAGLPAGVSGSLSVTTYTISGTPTETGIFNYTVTATGSGSCSGDMVSGTVIISEPLDPEFDPLGPYCVGEPADVLPAVSNNGVIGSWSPATISTATAGVTNYTFTPDAGQCATTKIISITVNTTPTNVDAGPDVSICEGESTQLQGSADLPSNNNVLLSQDFTGVSVFGLPAGWSRSNSLWGGMNTSYAGGSAPELSLLSDGSTNNDVYRVVTPLINAIDNQFLDLNFIHAVDHFNGAYRLAVQTSTDGVNWTNRWEFYWPATSGGDIPPESVNVDLSVMDDESFYIAFTYTGRLFNIGYWAIDNVELTGLFAEPVSVLWTPSTGLSDPTILKPIASPTETTTYTLTIGIGGCENSDQVTVTVVDNVIPTFSLDPEYTYCEGDSPVILPETSDNGISGTWSPSVISTETIGLTTYTFTPNPGECAYETSIDVLVKELPTATMSGGGDYCEGADPTGVDVQIDLTGEGPWLVRIDVDGDERDIVALSTPHTISNVGEGHFTMISVQDANCIGTVSGEAFVNEIPAPTATISGGGDYCAGTTPTGVKVIVDLTGTAPWSLVYAIDGVDQPAVTGINTSPYTIANATAGEYTLTSVADASCNGTVSGLATVVENPLPTAEISGGGSYCAGVDPTGIGLTVALTGSSPWTIVYAIHGVDQAAITGIATSPYIIEDATAGEYTLTLVEDATGCSGIVIGSAEVVENPLPTAEISGGGSYCAGTDPTGVDVTIDLTGEGPWTVVYAINGVSQPALIDIPTTPYVLTDATEGDYTLVSVVDANCTGTVSGLAQVVENPLPTAEISGGGSYCAGVDPTGIDLTVVLTGSSPWTIVYAIDGVDQPAVTGINTSPYTIANATAGEYTLTSVADASCDGTVSGLATVVENPLPTAEISGGGSYCAGVDPTGIDLTVTLTGSSPWTIVYAIDGVDQAAITGIATSPYIIEDATAGEYTLTLVEDATGCSGIVIGSAEVVENPLPTAEVSGGGNYCAGTDPTGVDVTIDLTGEGPWTVVYAVNGTSQPALVDISTTPYVLTDATAGDYTLVSVVDANCTGTVSGLAQVVENPLPTAEISGGGSYCAGVDPTGIDLTVVLTGSSPWTIVYAIDGVDQPAVTGINTSPYTIANATAGEYTISSVEDATGCIGTGIGLATVIEHELPHAIMSGGGSYCAGADPTGVDVQIDLTGEGPWLVRIAVDGDERNILASATPHIINDVGEGHFTIISVTDANCTGTVEGEAFVIELPLPEATISGGGEYCAGTDPTGVDVQINFSGIGPWDVIYAIDGVDQPEITGITTSPYTISNATVGVYTLTSVSDENCDGTVSGSATIVENSLPTAEISGGGSYCAGTDPTGINVTIDLTGVGPWTVVYAIDGLSQPALIDIPASPYVLTDVTAGDYTLVSVIDANCTGTVSGLAEVVENPLPTAEISGGGSYCAGTTPTGVDVTIDLTGEGPWTVVYAIDGASQPALIDILTSPYILADATEGEYTLVSVVDANCIGTVSGNATVVENPLPTATMSGGGSYCAGTDPTNVDVSIELTGTGPWTVIYAVDGLPNVVSGIDATPYVISDATKGEYTMIGVEDAFCSGTVSGSASVIEFEIPTAIMSGGGEYCKGADPTGVDVRIDFTGTAPWSYTFSADGDVRTLFAFTSPIIFNDVGEGYFVMLDVTDANCTGTVSGDALVVEIETAPPTGEANQEFCAGATIADIVVTGEAIAWYDSPGGSILAIDYVLVDGETYYATQTAEGCESLDNLAVTVTVYDEIIVSVPVVTDATCAGEPTGQVTVSASGGVGPYTFTLYNGIGDMLASLSDGLAATFNDVPAGTDFYIAVVDDIGCGPIESARFDVNEPDPIQIDINSIVVTDAICFGQESGTISLSASGGTGDLYFTLTSGGVAIGATQVGSGVFTNLAPGSYIVEISDDQGCGPVLSEELIVGEADPFTIELITDGNGNISIVTDGGTPPFNFDLQLFDGSTWVDVASSTDPEFNGLAEGDYRVIATDDNGCTDTKEISILLYSFTLTATDITCFGEVDGTIRVNEVGVTTDPYSLDERKWFNEFSEDISTYMMDRYDNTEGLYKGLEAGTYTLIGTKGGASHTETVIISEPEEIAVTYAVNYDNVCSPTEAEITFTITGGTTADGFYNISWAEGAFTIRDNLVPNLDEGSYIFVITDDNDCSYTLEVEITFPEKLEIENIEVYDVYCNGDTNGRIDVQASGTEPLTYKLEGSAGYTEENSIGIFSGLAPGNYTLTITDANNCFIVENHTITEPTPLTFTLSTYLETLPCHDSTVDEIEVTISGGTPDYRIIVDGTAIGSTSRITNLYPGNYRVNVVDDNNCSAGAVDLVVDGPKQPEYFDEFELPRCRVLANGRVDAGSIQITGVVSGTGNGSVADYEVDWYKVNEITMVGTLIKQTGIEGGVDGLNPGKYAAVVKYPRYDGQAGYCEDHNIYDLELNTDYTFSVDISGADNLWCYNSTDTLRVVMNSTIPLEVERVRWYNFTDNIERVHTESTPFMIENIDDDKNIILMVTTTDGCIEEATETVAIYDRIFPFIDRNAHLFFTDEDLRKFPLDPDLVGSPGDSTIISVLADTEYKIEMLTKNDDYTLNYYWTPTEGFAVPEGKEGTIFFKTPEYENLLSGEIFNIDTRKFEKYVPIKGYAIAEESGCREEISLKARILDKIRTSNVFSPNDDGINDIWTIPYSDIFPDLEIKIYNRWGHQVWSAKGTDAARGWNGRNRNGKELPTGTYYYVIKFNVDGTTKWKPVSGSVTIIR